MVLSRSSTADARSQRPSKTDEPLDALIETLFPEVTGVPADPQTFDEHVEALAAETVPGSGEQFDQRQELFLAVLAEELECF